MKLLIHEINIVNIFNDFKKFLTIFNISFDYNFNFSHSFNFNATCDDNLVIHECIFNNLDWAYYCLVKRKNGFFDNFDYQKLWETVALMACFNSFNFSRRIYRIFIVLMLYLIWLKKFSSSIYYYSFNANRFLEEILKIGKIKST